LKIYCKPESYPTCIIPSNVEVFCGDFPFGTICKDYDGAKLILIPLTVNADSTIGLTSLLDAIAMGKPVVMTKNDKIDLDFEKEIIGLTISERSIDAWVASVSYLLRNDELLMEMS